MKKKLLSFFALTAIAILAFAATQVSRRAVGTEIWSSDPATALEWSEANITVAAEKFADAKVGDILHVNLTDVKTGATNPWDAQVELRSTNWKTLTDAVNIAGTSTSEPVTDAAFVLTGDIVKILKSLGAQFNGTGGKVSSITLESVAAATGSDKSIWNGSVTEGNITVSLRHLANARNFTGIKAGDKIRVTFDKTSWVSGTSGWIGVQYVKGWTWTEISGDTHTETTVDNKWNGDPVDITINTDALAAELNDAENNHGLIILTGKNTTATQIELLPMYTVNINPEITNGKISVDKVTATDGDEVTITAVPNDGYKVKSITVTDADNQAVTVTNGKFKMPAKDVTVSATFNQSVDVTIAPASGDISEALNAAIAELGNNDAKNITINLAENATYTISAPIVAPASVTINGNGATIDASALEGNFIQMAAIEASSAWTESNVTVKGITVKGLKKALFYSGCKQYFGDVVVDNCVVELAADATTFDYTKGSTAVNFTVTNSTFYAPTATTKSFYSSQSGQKTTEYNADAVQTFKFENNTMYNLAHGKNFFTHRQNNQKWLKFVAKNNIFVDCGKSGQTIKGMNGGGSSANPQFDIDGNVFNFGGADTSADESTGDDAEPVKNSVVGRVLFKDAAKGDFGGTFVLAPETTSIPESMGDPRWTLTSAASFAINIALGIENGTVTTTPAGYAAKDEVVTIKGTPASGFSVESYSVKNGEESVSVGADATFKMPEAEVLVSAVFSKAPVDIAIAAADITGGDITAAIAAKKAALAEGETVGNITITLAEGTYTVSSPIEAPASLTINGAAGAVIDASALEAALITTPAGDLALWKEASLTVKDVTIKGVKKGVYASAGKNYLYNDFQIDNCVIEIASTNGLEFDFRKGGVAKNFTINKSTIYAPNATNNSLYTSQSAQKGTEAPGVTVQTFAITNSTLYNLAKGKNFFTHRQSNQKWLAYTIKNSVFLNVGKSGQVVKGINQGQSGANPTWDIDGNIFNFEGKDTSADETTGDEAEPVKNSIAGRVLFKDAAKGDFGGKFVLAPTTTSMPEAIGDPRWTLTSAASFAINIALGIENGTVTTTPAGYAAKDEVVTIKGTPASGFSVESYSVKNGEESVSVGADATFKMPEAEVLVSAVFSKAPVDIAIAAADITGGDITAAIAAKKAALAEGETVGNITITLAEGTYTVSSPIEAPASLTINGAAGAVIDASALEAALITTPAGDLALWKEASLTVKDVTIKGVKKGVYASAGKNYLYNDFQIDNCVIEIASTNGLEFDFRKGGVAKNFTINKSTIYAPNATNNSLYTSQSAQKGTEAPGVTVQTFAITNSTLYNLAKGKNFFTHRQSNQKWLAYTIKNSVFLNVGKSGQVVKGINQGQNGANPTWDIDGNIFNFEGKDTSADETTGDEAEPVKNSVAGIITFTDAAAGDFGGNFTLAPGTTAPETMPGDPRWTITTAAGYATTVGECTGGIVTVDKPYAAAGEKVYATFTPAEGYSPSGIVPTVKNDADEDVTSSITFGEDESGSYLIMPAFNITVSVVFQPLPKFYIIGVNGVWDRTAMTEMTYNKETGKYEYEFAPTETAYFAFADYQQTAEEAAADADWSVFNSTYRYSIGEGDLDATLGETKSLSKVNGTIVLQPGTYKIVVESDFSAVTITGEVAEDTYVVAGNSVALFGAEWDVTAEANKMTLNTTTGLYEITYSNVTLEAGTIEYKIVKNGGSTWIPDGTDNNLTVTIPSAGTYNVTFTFNPETNKITGAATDATGINGITVDGVSADIFSDGKPVYNLSGQRVFKGYKGVVIKNGKKIVVK